MWHGGLVDPSPGRLEVIGVYDISPDTQGFFDFCLIGSPFPHSSLKTSNLSIYADAYVSNGMYAIVPWLLRIISSDYLFYYYCFTLVWGEWGAMSPLGDVGSRHTLPPLCLSCPGIVSPWVASVGAWWAQEWPVWELDEHGSGQCGSLMSTGVASYGYAASWGVGCSSSVALEHGGEAEVEFGTGSLWGSRGGECPLRNFQSTLFPLLEVSGGLQFVCHMIIKQRQKLAVIVLSCILLSMDTSNLQWAA